MFFVLFFEPDKSSVNMALKFFDLDSARSCVRKYDYFGSVNLAIYSHDLQTCYFKNF